jgi:hypothetical protein
LASRGIRVLVARGSIPYSAVTQPCPVPFRNDGGRSSIVAVHRTRVLPTVIRHDPSALRDTPASIVTGPHLVQFPS